MGMRLGIAVLLGAGLGGLWMATGWDTMRERYLLRVVNWLMLMGLFLDLLWIVRLITGISVRNLAFIGVVLLVMLWTVLKDWATPPEE
jgi:hypothetical protein